jgi:Carbohydrate binding module (family 6)/Right handed beta helix region
MPNSPAPPSSSFRVRRVARALLLTLFVSGLNACSQQLTPLVNGALYVAVDGSDDQPGTSMQPFRTIQKCATSGGVCVVRAGTYRETVAPNSGVTIQADDGASVTVDGSDPVTGWTREPNGLYKAVVKLPIEGNRDTGFLANQIFVGDSMMREASYPNPSDDLMRPNWATMGAGTTKDAVNDPNLPAYDFVGATIRIYSGENAFAQQTGTISAASSGRVEFSVFSICPVFCALPGGRYLIVGGRDLRLVDSSREWLYKDGALYFYPPNGTDPNTLKVTAKQRNYAFDLRGKQGVTVKGIKIFASTVITDATSSNNVLDGLEVKYISHYNTLPLPNPSDLAYDEGDFNIVASHALDSGIVLNGTGNVLKNSTLMYSAGNGVLLRGSGNRVENNLIHDAGYTTSYATTVNITGSKQVVTRNTIYNAGRDGITVDWHINGKRFADNEISYNNVFNTNLLSPDGGGMYTCCFLDASGSSIHHNWIHDQQVVNGYNPTRSITGLYMDNRSEKFDVYQNVFWNNVNNGLILNGNNDTPGNKINQGSTVRNNTFLNDADLSINLRDVDDATGSKVFDNLVSSGVAKINSTFTGGEERGNGVSGAGATEGYTASVGCDFAGCESTKPPPTPGTLPWDAVYTRQAELFDDQSGNVTRNAADIGSLDNGDWVKYSSLDFGVGVREFSANLGVDAAFAGQALELRLDSPQGKLIGSLTVAATGGFEVYTVQTTPVSAASGVHDLFLVARGGSGVANLDSFRFVR